MNVWTKILGALLVVSILSFFGVLIYRATYTHNANESNCQQVQNLRDDIVEVFHLSKEVNNKNLKTLKIPPLQKAELADNNNQFLVQATAIIEKPTCKV